MQLEVSNLLFQPKGIQSPILSLKHLSILSGAALCISGESGSGKSSLLNLISGLDVPKNGKILWDKTDITQLSPLARDRWRGQNVGLIMQNFYLINELSAIDNVLLPSFFSHKKSLNLKNRAIELLKEVGIKDTSKKTSLHSRGQIQRIAVARALLYEPKILIADEPSASLDRENSQKLANLLTNITRQHAITFIIATHDQFFKDMIEKHIVLNKNSQTDKAC